MKIKKDFNQMKFQFRLMGWITLIVFPAIGFFLLWFFKDYSFEKIISLLEFDQFFNSINLLGLELGFFYGFLVLFISQSSFFKELAVPQTELIKKLNLNWFDILFISLCAGIGEEILFRVSIQTWLGPWLTTFVFIAIHGYFSIKVWQKNALGLLLFPFILLLAYAYEEVGFWFVVAAHFSYDLLMFMGVRWEK